MSHAHWVMSTKFKFSPAVKEKTHTHVYVYIYIDTHLGLAVVPSCSPLAGKQIKGELGVQNIKVYTCGGYRTYKKEQKGNAGKRATAQDL